MEEAVEEELATESLTTLGGCEITRDSSLVEDLGLSSLDVMNLIGEFEDEFDISIPDRIIPSIHTVDDIVCYLEEHAE